MLETVDLGKSVSRLGFQIVSSKLGLVISTSQGCFQGEIRECKGKRSGADTLTIVIPTFAQFMSAKQCGNRDQLGGEDQRARPVESACAGLRPSSPAPGEVSSGQVNSLSTWSCTCPICVTESCRVPLGGPCSA